MWCLLPLVHHTGVLLGDLNRLAPWTLLHYCAYLICTVAYVFVNVWVSTLQHNLIHILFIILEYKALNVREHVNSNTFHTGLVVIKCQSTTSHVPNSISLIHLWSCWCEISCNLTPVGYLVFYVMFLVYQTFTFTPLSSHLDIFLLCYILYFFCQLAVHYSKYIYCIRGVCNLLHGVHRWYGFSSDKVQLTADDFRDLVECVTGRRLCAPLDSHPALSFLTDCQANTALTQRQCAFFDTV